MRLAKMRKPIGKGAKAQRKFGNEINITV